MSVEEGNNSPKAYFCFGFEPKPEEELLSFIRTHARIYLPPFALCSSLEGVSTSTAFCPTRKLL